MTFGSSSCLIACFGPQHRSTFCRCAFTLCGHVTTGLRRRSHRTARMECAVGFHMRLLPPQEDAQSVGLQRHCLPVSSLEVCGPQCAGKVAAATEMPVTLSRSSLTAFPNINSNNPSPPRRVWRGAERLCCLAAATMEHVQALFGAASCLQLTRLRLLIRSGESSAVRRDANHSPPACHQPENVVCPSHMGSTANWASLQRDLTSSSLDLKWGFVS